MSSSSRPDLKTHWLRGAQYLVLISAICVTLAGCAPREPTGHTAAKAMVDLGSALFADARLSADGQVSCASCHDPRRQFTDARAVSIGVHKRLGTRNAPSLVEVSAMQSFFWDGRETVLERAVLQPFTNGVEMGLADQSELVARVRELPEYSDSFARAFGDGGSIDSNGISAALAAYLRSLSHQKNLGAHGLKFRGGGEPEDAIAAGRLLFEGKAECSACHLPGRDRLLTDHQFHHTGVGFERVAGKLGEMIPKIDAVKDRGLALGNAVLSDASIAELGRFVTTRRPQDLGAFRTPSLRNVALTAPYMHDGSIMTLESAVERELYYRGLARGRPISLTVEEQRQLIAYLESLSSANP